MADEPYPEDRRRRIIKLGKSAHKRRENFWAAWQAGYLEAAKVNMRVLNEQGLLTEENKKKAIKLMSKHKRSIRS